jgi:HSP20 family protein
MSLIKWKSNELFPNLDSLWDYSFNRDFYSKGMQLGTTIPAVNTMETETSYQLELAIPGLKKEDFK